MNTLNSFIAIEIKQRNVIDMALAFTAMIRLFEKGSKSIIAEQLLDECNNLEIIGSKTDFDRFHDRFCDWFTQKIKTAQRIKNNRVIKKSYFAFYGHASKLLDVSLKVYVYYAGLPNQSTSNRILQYLNTGIDYPLLQYLKKIFPNENIFANTVEQIDRSIYKKLQELIRLDIKNKFNHQILPIQYDDIMWFLLNRENIPIEKINDYLESPPI